MNEKTKERAKKSVKSFLLSVVLFLHTLLKTVAPFPLSLWERAGRGPRCRAQQYPRFVVARMKSSLSPTLSRGESIIYLIN